MAPLRILIADDHRLFREAVREILTLDPNVLVVGEAADGEEAAERCRELQPHVALLDLSMPRLSGLEALAQIRKTSRDTAVVMLTARIEHQELFEALLLGVRGVILKSAETENLLECVRTVAAGGYWFEQGTVGDLVATLQSRSSLASLAARPQPGFTERERQIVLAITDGASNAEIGHAFGLSSQTVKNHLTKIFDKAGVSTRVELALYALHHRIGGMPPGEVAVPVGPRGSATAVLAVV
jgi:two-component system, NarL family, nitrate/nitrite response regulator NarL